MHRNLAEFEQVWEESGIDKVIETVKYSFDEAGNPRVTELVKPRERTSQENRVADARQKIRQVKAEREVEAEEKAAFDALT